MEKVQFKQNNTRFISSLNKTIRILFYGQILISLLSFAFCPFKIIDTVKSYKYETIGGKIPQYLGEIITNCNRSITLESKRLREVHIETGDTITILKNLIYKTEGIIEMKEQKTFFTLQKWAWCFVWSFALIISLVSSKFKGSNDLKIKESITYGLAILFLLYFII